MKTQIVLIIVILSFFGRLSAQQNLTPAIENKIDSLLKIMSVDEEIGQVNQLSYGSGWGPNAKKEIKSDFVKMIKAGEIGSFLNAVGVDLTYELQKISMEQSHLKIPLLFGFDVIHGFKTTFPVPLAESCSWDTSIIKMSAKYQALEASAVGVHWTFAPMLDIARDPRWGRIVEGAGEDPYLGSRFAAARVRGLQGDLSEFNIAACAKHFAAYGCAEGGRDYNTVDVSERTLREIYFPPFKAAVEAGAMTFMSSFNEISGIPSTGNKWLLTDVLRNEWGFNGFVVSDWGSISEMTTHGFAKDTAEAAKKGIVAGCDMDMQARAYKNKLKSLITDGKIPKSLLDESVRRILRVKYKLGLFDNPYKYCNKDREKSTVLSPEMQNAALDASRHSIVLLKNNGDLLPLSKSIKKIAVIGPLASAKKFPLGSWEQFGDSNDVVSLIEGIKNKFTESKILFSQGCSVRGDSKTGFADAVKAAEESDIVIAAIGEEGHMSGEAYSRSDISLPGVQQELLAELKKTGKPIVAVLMNGRPLAIEWVQNNIPAIIEAWFLGIKSGDAIADVLSGDFNPSGKLTVSFPRATGQIPIYYNHKNTGRPFDSTVHYSSGYYDTKNSPLYPFGYGLSYSRFKYSDLTLSSKELHENNELKVSVTVENASQRDGEEVVELYLRDNYASVTRPIKELKGFRKVFIKSGGKLRVEFSLSRTDLLFYDINMKYTTEEGMHTVMVGASSEDYLQSEFYYKQ